MFRRSSSGDTPASRVASGSTVRLVCIRFSRDRKSTRLNSSHDQISYAVFCLKKKNNGFGQFGVHSSETIRSAENATRPVTVGGPTGRPSRLLSDHLPPDLSPNLRHACFKLGP